MSAPLSSASSAAASSPPVPEVDSRALRVSGLLRGGGAPLAGASFEAAPGELTVLLSEDGSGQALLRAATGIDPVDSGASALRGERLDRRRGDSNSLTPRQVGLIAPGLDFRSSSLAAALAEWLEAGPEEGASRELERVGESLGFAGLGTAHVAELPEALRHRAAIGRVLVPGPGMLAVLDPFGSLPGRERLMLEGMLRVLAHEYGLPVVYATGTAESASRAHRVVRVSGGEVVADVYGWANIKRAFPEP